MCSLESYANFKACFFTGVALLVLNMSQFYLALSLGFPDFLLTDDYLILGCLAVGLSMSFCLNFGADNDRPRPRSGKPFLATIFLAIVQLGLYFALIIFPIDGWQMPSIQFLLDFSTIHNYKSVILYLPHDYEKSFTSSYNNFFKM